MNNCPFCLDNHLLKGDIISRTDDAYTISAQFNPGCYLTVPEIHAESVQDLPDNWWRAAKTLIPKVPELTPDYNLSFNVSKIAGQTVRHLHLWIIPRESGQPASNTGLAGLIYKVNQAA